MGGTSSNESKVEPAAEGLGPPGGSGRQLRHLLNERHKNIGSVTKAISAAVEKKDKDVILSTATSAPVPDVKVEELFAWAFLKYPIGISHFLFFCLWLPVGALLLFVRVFVMISFLVIMYSLPNWISDVVTPVLLINCILPFCGIFVYGNGKQKLKTLKEPYILAGNHMSNYDPFFMNALESTSTLVGTGTFADVWFTCSQIGLIRDGGIICTSYFGTKEDREQTKEQISTALDMTKSGPSPLLIYPEGCVQNSRVALLMYQRYVFSLGKTVVPVAMTVWNPWPYEHYWMGCEFVETLGAYLFSPFLIFSYTALDPMKIEEGETSTEFAARCQFVTADFLGIGVSNIHWKEKSKIYQALGYDEEQPEIWKGHKIGDYRKDLKDRLRGDFKKRGKRMSIVTLPS